MPVTNFGAVAANGVPVGGLTPAGNVYYVDNSHALDSDNAYSGSSSEAPFATLAFALTQATANHGDVIVIGAGHTETLATALALTSKAGVTFYHVASGVSWITGASNRLVGSGGERLIKTAAAVMVDATTIFTIAGGPILVQELVSVCVTANDGTASTLQWGADPTDGAAATFTGASASLASAAAGATVTCIFTALTTAPTLAAAAAGGVALSRAADTGMYGGIVVPAGIITTTIGVGSTTGTWSHHLLYRPLAPGVVVT